MSDSRPEQAALSRDTDMTRTAETRRVIETMVDGLNDHRIDDIGEGTFGSYLLVSSGDEEKLIDARPSDAVALALRAHTPIYVDAIVLDEAGVSDEESKGTNGEE